MLHVPQVFAVSVTGPDDGMVSLGDGGMSSPDMWVSPAVATQLPMPPIWSGGFQSPPASPAPAVAAPNALNAANILSSMTMPGTSLGDSPASRIRSPGSPSEDNASDGIAPLDGLREWVGPTGGFTATDVTPDATQEAPENVKQQQATAAQQFLSEFEDLLAVSRPLSEGLKTMGASVREALAHLPDIGRQQRSAAAVVAAAAEHADGVDTALLSRQADTVPGFQIALTTLQDFAAEQAALDKQVSHDCGRYLAFEAVV